MTEEQMIKKIKKMNKKLIKRTPGGGMCGAYKYEDTSKGYYYYHSFRKDKVLLFNSFDEVFDAVTDDCGWFYNYIVVHFSRAKMKMESIIKKIREAFQRMIKVMLV